MLCPFGEVYPETKEDIHLALVMTYLDYGGTWITSGGVPFYYRPDISNTSNAIVQLADEHGRPVTFITGFRLESILGERLPLAMGPSDNRAEAFALSSTDAGAPMSSSNVVFAWRYLDQPLSVLPQPLRPRALLRGRRLRDAEERALVTVVAARRGWLVHCGLKTDTSEAVSSYECVLMADAVAKELSPPSASPLLQ